MNAVTPLQPAIEARLIELVRAVQSARDNSLTHLKGKQAMLAGAYLALESAVTHLRKAEDSRDGICSIVANTLAKDYEQNRAAQRSAWEAQMASEDDLRNALKASPYSLDDLPWMAEEADARDTVLYEFCLTLIQDRQDELAKDYT